MAKELKGTVSHETMRVSAFIVSVSSRRIADLAHGEVALSASQLGEIALLATKIDEEMSLVHHWLEEQGRKKPAAAPIPEAIPAHPASHGSHPKGGHHG